MEKYRAGRLAALTLAAAAIAEACSPTPAAPKPEPTPTTNPGAVIGVVGSPTPKPSEAPSPSPKPTESPIPSAVLQPSASVTETLAPSESVEVTPTPSVSPSIEPSKSPDPIPSKTPKPTPTPKVISISDIENGPHPTITYEKVVSDMTKVFDAHIKDFKAHKITKEAYLNMWKYARNGDPAVAGRGDPFLNKQVNYQLVIGNSYQLYLTTGDALFAKIADETFDDATHKLPKVRVEALKSNLEQLYG